MRNLLLASSLALCVASSAIADTFTLSAVTGGAATGSNTLNFDSLLLGSTTQWANPLVQVSFTGTGEVVQGALKNRYAAPFVSGSNGAGFGSQAFGADTTPYLTTGIGSVTLEFTSNQTYLGLLWGSVDDYNALDFYNGDTLVGSFTGTDIWANANGDQGQQGTFYVNFNNTSGSFNRVVASSTSYGFELDNVAYNSLRYNVPESGATWTLLGLALAALFVTRRKA